MGVTNPEKIADFLARIRAPRRSSGQGGGSDKHTSLPIRLALSSAMAKAKRQGGWFRLTRLERGIFSLALRVNAKFESASLTKAMVSVLKKLREVSHPLYERFLRGAVLAEAFSDAASGWGNQLAKDWKHDKAYAIYLGLFMTTSARP